MRVRLAASRAIVPPMDRSHALRLPRGVEKEPGAAGRVRAWMAGARPLWAAGRLPVPRVPLIPALASELQRAFSAGRIVRGLEDAERALAAEARGLQHVDRRTGVQRGGRVSRLLVLADDGSERFYRNVESLLRAHAPRVLALRLPVDQEVLGGLVFGPGQLARLLLIEHKDAVTSVLLALASEAAPGS